MNILILIETIIQLKAVRHRADKADGSRARFLHHIAQGTGKFHFTAALQDVHFYAQQLTAHAGPCQSVDNADRVGRKQLLFFILRSAEIVGKIFNGEANLLLFLLYNFGSRLTHQLSDQSLERTHTRFGGITLYDTHICRIRDRHLFAGQTVLFHLLREQMPFGDLQFFLRRVAGKLNDFHSVIERRGNCGRVISGRHKKDFGKVIRYVDEIIHKGVVLFAVKHLQHRRGRVPLVIGAEFVNLIKEHQRIGSARAFDCRNDFSLHCADIGTAVTANFRFIVHTAKRNAHIFSTHRFRKRFCNTGFADAGRTDKTNDLTVDILFNLSDGNDFKYSFLYLLNAVVVSFQNLASTPDVKIFFAVNMPGQRNHRIQIVSDYIRIGRGRGHFSKLLSLANKFLLNFFLKADRFDFFYVFIRFTLCVIRITQLFSNSLKLFTQVVFALVFFHLFAHFFLNRRINFDDCYLFFKRREQLAGSFDRIRHFQKRLQNLIIKAGKNTNAICHRFQGLTAFHIKNGIIRAFNKCSV